ncbi:uncharacterized protein TRIVIDRAFT_63741 [Trichoderma virens Gv29-8]|uniref:Uncharacterized protein n=1 Tax=Hypocrea virens (strain Gv29-8 / FGSC 10586) TaxID=413071 RepID=G9MFY3_HYPVG|nr:uncharacterized protein TRIVIDRAFT_63741 [Trichoderma virens Gv29-8]EHK26434.1 hypothetical protein TRIVIDRAFT_63741 [Trichoderma virens Gv29-8]UKZ46615.1 hypothetical protein TrVGV298_000820 [Trichoderma virens]
MQTGSLDLIHDEHLLALLPMPLHTQQEKSMAPNRVRSVTRRYTSFENGHGPVPGTWRIGGPSPFLFDKNVQFSDDGLETCWRRVGGTPGSPVPATPSILLCVTSHQTTSRQRCLHRKPLAVQVQYWTVRSVALPTVPDRQASSGNCVNAPRAPEAVHCGKASGGTKGLPAPGTQNLQASPAILRTSTGTSKSSSHQVMGGAPACRVRACMRKPRYPHLTHWNMEKHNRPSTLAASFARGGTWTGSLSGACTETPIPLGS